MAKKDLSDKITKKEQGLGDKEVKTELSDKVATLQHVVTDQGNGGAYCSNCKYVLGSDPLKTFLYYGKNCPSCDYLFKYESIYVQQGGSDF